MAINNVTNVGVNFATSETLGTGLTSPTGLPLGLSAAALQNPELQALLTSINPSQSLSVAQQPLPFSVASLPASIFDPVQLTSSLGNSSTGLQSAIDTLNQRVDDDQATVNADAADPNTDPKKMVADAQKLNQDMQEYQVMVNLQATIENILTSLDNKIIDNMKIQG